MLGITFRMKNLECVLKEGDKPLFRNETSVLLRIFAFAQSPAGPLRQQPHTSSSSWSTAIYSCRNAFVGSIFVARRAGT